MLIAIDHGNKQMKTASSQPFISGLTKSMTEPYGEDVLQYEDAYYMLSSERLPYQRNKTEDERYFILTLFAIARELSLRGLPSETVMQIQLAVGLPPAHYAALNRTFADYFSGRGVIRFQYRKKKYAVCIDEVRCYPQAYAAAVTVLQRIMDCPKALVVDIGGFTADYLLMRNGKGDLSTCDSLEKGVILFYNGIRSKVNAEFDRLLEEADIDAILRGEQSVYKPEIVEMVQAQAQTFVNDLFNQFRERQLDLRSSRVVFVGGGAALLRREIENSGKVENAIFVEDINANAKGYELLYRLETKGRR